MKVTYHKEHSFIDNENIHHNFISQLYKIGVYGILDGDPTLQVSFQPSHIVKIENDLKRMKKKGEIKNCKFKYPITVSDEDGFWKEI